MAILLASLLLVVMGVFVVITLSQLSSKHKNGRASTPGTVKPSRGRSTQKRPGGSSYKSRSRKSR